MSEFIDVKENLNEVHKKIEQACKRSGRDLSEVTLICVSKTKPIEMLKEAFLAGEHEFGENKVQEIVEKKPQLDENARFHMIGHLQTNKVKQVIDKVVLIHSVDSKHLADEINKEAAKKGIIVNILIEVNVANEDTKYGVSEEETEELVRYCAVLSNVKVCGLMTIAPFVNNPEDNRLVFRKIKNLCVDLTSKNIDNINMSIISMGMTGDYEVAIEEGSTMVRVGTGIFGSRNYNI